MENNGRRQERGEREWGKGGVSEDPRIGLRNQICSFVWLLTSDETR